MGYGQYTVPDDRSCRTYFCCFPLALENTFPWPFLPILSNFFEEQRTQNHPQCLSGLSRALFPTTFLEIAVWKTRCATAVPNSNSWQWHNVWNGPICVIFRFKYAILSIFLLRESWACVNEAIYNLSAKIFKLHVQDDTKVVNSLVIYHPWCTTKWSLTGGGRLRKKSRKGVRTDLINVIKLINYYLTSYIRQINKW